MKKLLFLFVILCVLGVLYGAYVCVYASGEDIIVESKAMEPELLSTSLKKKGHKYTYTFNKGTSAYTKRARVIPIDVHDRGDVRISTNKTKLSYGIYQDQACTKKAAITSKGRYYVKVSQNAYAIDLLDHNKALYKKASITFYLSQISSADRSLKAKTYTCLSGQPKIKIHSRKGLIKMNSTYVNETGKYVKGGSYKIASTSGQVYQTLQNDEYCAVMKGDYLLIPDGAHTYRLKYTIANAPAHKNIKQKKAASLKVNKKVKGVFFNNQKDHRYYKMTLESKGRLNFLITGLNDAKVSLYHLDQKKNIINDTLDGHQVAHATLRYTSRDLDQGTYYLKLTKVIKEPVGIYYTIERNA